MAVESYSKRLCSPFQGVLQVVAADRARALSFNGLRWELQCSCQLTDKDWKGDAVKKHRYIRFGRWSRDEGLSGFPLDPRINIEEVEFTSSLLQSELEVLAIPLPMDDFYEYWLLNEDEQMPLALLASCRHADEREEASGRVNWEPVSAAELKLQNTDEEQMRGLPPVTYRLESVVRKRAGQNPVAVWYQRDSEGNAARQANIGPEQLNFEQFPALLLREDWPDENSADLAARYLARLAPRLLVLQHSNAVTRKRLEYMAAANALEVGEHVHLYPDIIDRENITSLRVEASLRRAAK